MQTTLDALAEFPRRFEAHFAAVPPELLRWAPPRWEGIPSERLTPIEQAWHLRDIEIDGYRERFRRTLAEAQPILPDLDGEGLARERHYASRDPDEALREFRAAREENVALLRSLSPSDFDRVAVFEGAPVTLRTLVHTLCSHDLQHLSGLQWLLGRMATPRTPIAFRKSIPHEHATG